MSTPTIRDPALFLWRTNKGRWYARFQGRIFHDVNREAVLDKVMTAARALGLTSWTIRETTE
jgi:hypothetical protein